MSVEYELGRVTAAGAFYRKLLQKRLLFKLVGETYVGKRVKLAYFERWLRRIPLPEQPRILEAGSGDGVFTFFVASKYPRAQVRGLELNPAEVAACRRIARVERRHNLDFAQGSLTKPIAE